MSDLVYFVLAAYGMTQILVYGSILNPIRPKKGKLGELFECPMCMGFWVGVFLWGSNTQTELFNYCLLYTSPSPRDKRQSRMPSSA